MKLTVSPPRNFLNQVVWLQSQLNSVISTSSAIVTPFAYVFNLSAQPFAAEVQTLFDQYSIYAVKFSLAIREPQAVSGVLVATAVDYDGQTFLTPPNTFNAIQQFGTCLTTTLTNSSSQERFLKPCCAVSAFNSTGSAFTAYATDRLWIDSGIATVPFYGILGVADANAGASSIEVTITALVCCRNNN